MKGKDKCPNCGAPLINYEEQGEMKCPYCNSIFEKENKVEKTQTATIKDLQVDEVVTTTPHKPLKLNIFVLVILFCINPFFAIIYLIAKIIKRK